MRALTKAVSIAAAVTVAACTADTIAYDDREPFNPAVTAAAGFLGYAGTGAKQTICGSCHEDVQDEWERTAHADAFAAPATTGHASASCYPCHTVNERGNAVTGTAGFNLLSDSVQAVRYHDVQCESCHGPGADHIAGPASSAPLASIAVAESGTDGCGACHTDVHHPFVEQWKTSAHAAPSAQAAGNPNCEACHEGRAALEEQFGVQSVYRERAGTEPQPITCAVCHDPHGGSSAGQLRADVGVASEANLCVHCHDRRATPPNAGGPHGAQGPLVLGRNVGWMPPGFDFTYRGGLAGTHGSEDNPRLCATCHLAAFEVLDASSQFVFQSVGHSFEALPCTNVDGVPVAGPCAVDDRNFDACGGCHIPAGDAKQSYLETLDRLHALLDEIWYDTDGDGVMDPTDAGVLPGVVALGDAAALDLRDAVVTVAEGTLWNAQLAFTDDRPWFGDGEVFGEGFRAHRTSGNGVHNPFFLEALLLASIEAVQVAYGVAPSPAFDATPRMTPPPGVR